MFIYCKYFSSLFSRVSNYRLTFLLIIITICVGSLKNINAQISKTHYLPPLFGQADNITEFKIVLTTLETEPFKVTIKNGDGTFEKKVTLSRTSPQEISPKDNNAFIGFPIVKPSNNDDQSHLLEYLNTVLPDQGFTLTADKPFFANYMTTIPAQGEILTSKGAAGVGTLFYTGHQHMSYSSGNDKYKSHFTSIMALNDDTEIECYNSRVLYYGQPDKRFTITLNKGESYIIGNSAIGIKQMCGISDECFNDYNGTRISSTRDIVVNSGSIHGGYTASNTNASRDIGFDQIAPAKIAGTEYILVEGNGTEKNAKNEVAIVVATEDDTQIQVNGKTDASNSYSLKKEGDYVIIPWEKYTNYTMHLKSDKNIVVYQTLSGNDSEVSPGMMFIPRLSPNTTKEVVISGLGTFFEGGKNGNDGPSLYITTKDNAHITVNSTEVPQNLAEKIDGADHWVSYRITDLKPYSERDEDMYVTASQPMTAAVSFISDVVGGGGYYSGFTEAESHAGIGTIGTLSKTIQCEEEISLIIKGGLSYQWSSIDVTHWDLLEWVTDSSYTFSANNNDGEGPFIYEIISEEQSPGGLQSFDTTQLSITVEACSKMIAAVIYDNDTDGVAETILVTFDESLNALPDSITSIDWPKEGENNLTVYAKEMEFYNSSKKVITLSFHDAFESATGADKKYPPSIEHNGTSVLLYDRIAPVILTVAKRPPEFNNYAIRDEEGKLTFYPQSDTLLITTSEPVSIENDWKELFTLSSESTKSFIIALKEKPFYSEVDEQVLVVVIDNRPGNQIPMVGDEISFTKETKSHDPSNNTPYENYITISGKDGFREGTGITFRNPIVGINDRTRSINTQIFPIYDKEGILLEEKSPDHVSLPKRWIAPVQFHDGVIDPHYECDDDTRDDEQSSVTTTSSFDRKCLASLIMGTFAQEGPYTSTIYVYDQLGQFITSWSQMFGFCGEYTNEKRRSQTDIDNYFLNELVWDLKDSEGRKVGSGVYHWIVKTTFDSGKQTTVSHKMGIVRQSEECE